MSDANVLKAFSLVAKVWSADVVAEQRRAEGFLSTFFSVDVWKTVHT